MNFFSHKSNHDNNVNAFTLIELILYIAIYSIIVTSIISMSLMVVYGRLKINSQKEVIQNLRYVSDRIIYEVKNSSGVTQVSSNQITLANNDPNRNPTSIEFRDNSIYLGAGLDGSCNHTNPCSIVSENIFVDEFVLSDLSKSTNGIDTIGVYLKMSYLNPNNISKISAEGDLSFTVNTLVSSD